MNRYRTNADGSIVCPHRDLSCCPACLAADPTLHDVVGAVFQFTTAEWAEFEAEFQAEARAMFGEDLSR